MQRKREWGAGRIAFLAKREVIRGELEAGLSLTAIYARYQDALGIGYVQFTRYVSIYLRRANDTRPRSAPAPPRKPTTNEPPKPKGFQFDPMAIEKKKLI
jgi:hypothetical protein